MKKRLTELKQYIKQSLIIESTCWALFCVQDYIIENNISSVIDSIFGFMCMALPALQIVYLIFSKRLSKDISNRNKYCLSNVIVSVITGAVAFLLLANNIYIVEQAQNGWDNFLNGIEYYLYIIYFDVFTPLVLAISLLIIRITTYILNRHKNKK